VSFAHVRSHCAGGRAVTCNLAQCTCLAAAIGGSLNAKFTFKETKESFAHILMPHETSFSLVLQEEELLVGVTPTT